MIRRLADAIAARQIDDDLYYWLLDLASDLPADTVEEAGTMRRVDHALSAIFTNRDGLIDDDDLWEHLRSEEDSALPSYRQPTSTRALKNAVFVVGDRAESVGSPRAVVVSSRSLGWIFAPLASVSRSGHRVTRGESGGLLTATAHGSHR